MGFAFEVYAQMPVSNLTIPTFDRPGIADAPYMPPRGSFQVEFGTGLSGQMQSDRLKEAKLLNPVVLFRYAQATKLEWRVQWNYAPPLASLDDYLDRSQTQLMAIGAKVSGGKGHGWLPDWGLMGNLMIDPRYRLNMDDGKRLGGDLYLVTMHNLPYGFSINTNGGLGWFPSSSSLTTLGALAVNWAPGGPWGIFGEVYNFGGRGQHGQSGWDAGLTYLLNHDQAQIDLSWMDSDLSQKGGGVLLVGFSRNFSKVP